MQERVFSSGENSGGRHWGKALFWAEEREWKEPAVGMGWGETQYLWEQAAGSPEAPQNCSGVRGPSQSRQWGLC